MLSTIRPQDSLSVHSLTMRFLSTLCAVSSLLGAVQAVDSKGTITNPLNGTHIAPGESFEFTYNTRNDACLSSYNYTVWLLTSPPSTLSTLSTTGVFLGRFSDRTYFSKAVSIQLNSDRTSYHGTHSQPKFKKSSSQESDDARPHCAHEPTRSGRR